MNELHDSLDELDRGCPSVHHGHRLPVDCCIDDDIQETCSAADGLPTSLCPEHVWQCAENNQVSSSPLFMAVKLPFLLLSC